MFRGIGPTELLLCGIMIIPLLVLVTAIVLIVWLVRRSAKQPEDPDAPE